jgi:hypothetical protein
MILFRFMLDVHWKIMAKKQSKKKEKSKEDAQKAKSSDAPAEEAKPFDFGGIPDRDLKKNLGCG